MKITSILTSLAALWIGTAALAEEFKMAVTTSFANSGLAEVLLPQIKADTGLDVQLLIVGTGQALALGAALLSDDTRRSNSKGGRVVMASLSGQGGTIWPVRLGGQTLEFFVTDRKG